MIVAEFLQTEYFNNPIGIDAEAPLFTWKYSGAVGEKQAGCRLMLFRQGNSSAVWDSGRVDTAEPRLIYAGPALESRTSYTWQVCLYNTDGEQGAWSESAAFETGLLDPALWQGQWLGLPTMENYVILYRCVKEIAKPVRRARAYLAAEGFAELWINGEKIGRDVLDPADTDYSRLVLYRTYDLTEKLGPGRHAVGIRLSRGWAPRGKFLLQIHLEFTDGTEDVICSQVEGWKAAISPIRCATIYSGEVYDARMECPEWNDPSDRFEQTHTPKSWGFFEYIEDPECPDQRWWFPAIEMPVPGGVLRAQNVEPIRNIEELRAQKISQAPDGSWVVDFGQNLAGWVRLRFHGQRGDVVKLEHSELLNSDGTLNMAYLTSANPHYPLPMQTDTYIIKDTEPVVYEPQFTYHGFRYAAISGLRYEPAAADVTGVVACSDVPQRAEFTCDNELLMRIHQAIVWSEKTNLHSIPTDCPQRAERHGWLNDMTVRAEAAVYQFDMRRFYRKFLEDIRTTQDPVSGAIADTAPFRHGNFPADPVSCYLLLPYLLYWQYGDIGPIGSHYDAMKKLIEYWDRNIVDGVLAFSLYGDWASPADFCRVVWGNVTPVSVITPGAYISTCYHYYHLTLMEKFAELLGKKQDQTAFRCRAEEMKAAILERFYDPETGNFALGSQGANVLALYLKLVPAGKEEQTLQRLVEDLRRHDNSLTTGNLCTKYLLEVLSEYGQVDLAYRLAVRTDYPSWGYMLENGATTIWERWEYKTGVDMNSHNHSMYGSINAWMYKYLAGISPLEPGYREILIRPYIPADLPSAAARIDTAYGRAACSWEQNGTALTVEVEIPQGTDAIVSLPGGYPQRDGRPVDGAQYKNGRWEIRCPQGRYRFVSLKG